MMAEATTPAIIASFDCGRHLDFLQGLGYWPPYAQDAFCLSKYRIEFGQFDDQSVQSDHQSEPNIDQGRHA